MSTSTSPKSAEPRPGTESFSFPGYRGAVAAGLGLTDLEGQVRRMADPASARETLHWGRSYLYASELDAAGGAIEVVVKQFRNQGLRSGLRRRRHGCGATRSWRGAGAMVASGLATPEPLMLIETLPGGPSYYVSRRLRGVFESRLYFRALNAGRGREAFPQVDETEFFARLGGFLRRLHDAGIWHRDVSIGNVLVGDGDSSSPPRFYLVDLSRSRLGRRLTVWRRTRDLCRLPILQARNRRTFLHAYWGPETRAPALKRLLFWASMQGFLLKHRIKGAVWHPLRSRKLRLGRRHPHVHIPPAPRGASTREKVVWDALSDQPHQHAGRFERVVSGLRESGGYLYGLSLTGAALPRTWRRYRALERGLYSEPVDWRGVGVALRPRPEERTAPLRHLEALGVRKVLLRLHPWQRQHREEEELARELHRRGYEIAFTLPQNRELVLDHGRWRAALEEIAARFLPFGRSFQVGQAINRSKWGVWSFREYLELAAIAAAVLRGAGEVELLGPSVIDFEFHFASAVLNMRHEGVFFDGVSSLLYVDRRGAPENAQLGFDTVGKVVLLRAIAETARNCAGRCWITEVNWPLWEGPHAPAGRHVAVDEETQADYLVRYYLLALGTGLVERIYWWQLIAHGYGLVDGSGRRRPSFHALANMQKQLAGARLMGPLEAEHGARLFLLERQGEELVVGWGVDREAEARLPRPAREAIDRDGEPLPVPASARVRLSASPTYFRLSSR